MIFLGITLALIAAAVLALGTAYSAIRRRGELATDLVIRRMVLFALWALLYAFEFAAARTSATETKGRKRGVSEGRPAESERSLRSVRSTGR